MNRRLAARGASHAHQFDMEGPEHALDLSADGAAAHKQHILARKFF